MQQRKIKGYGNLRLNIRFESETIAVAAHFSFYGKVYMRGTKLSWWWWPLIYAG
ncbi:hypothetical protein C5167_024491 [Papaver somniferum]|uniref:Uncharacterized protein n=1 Tax=Papaver somniferum TaxID=3469 RepID=A0A4Y7JRS1_PAPSO|nr:hypothetical protein C5167_024491 [Papaver somniferum]